MDNDDDDDDDDDDDVEHPGAYLLLQQVLAIHHQAVGSAGHVVVEVGNFAQSAQNVVQFGEERAA